MTSKNSIVVFLTKKEFLSTELEINIDSKIGCILDQNGLTYIPNSMYRISSLDSLKFCLILDQDEITEKLFDFIIMSNNLQAIYLVKSKSLSRKTDFEKKLNKTEIIVYNDDTKTHTEINIIIKDIIEDLKKNSYDFENIIDIIKKKIDSSLILSLKLSFLNNQLYNTNVENMEFIKKKIESLKLGSFSTEIQNEANKASDAITLYENNIEKGNNQIEELEKLRDSFFSKNPNK